MIVRLTDEAERDVEAIGDYIAQDNPETAASFIAKLRAKCLDLADFPNRFPLVPRHETQGVRHRVHGDYLIFYRAAAEEVVVLHILHGAMDYVPLLFPT